MLDCNNFAMCPLGNFLVLRAQCLFISLLKFTTIEKEAHILFYINFSIHVIEKYDHVKDRSFKVNIKSLILVSMKADFHKTFVCRH